MTLPSTAHTSRPWRIHEIVPDFRLEDVWALPTSGGPDDFPRLVRLLASLDSCALRRLAASYSVPTGQLWRRNCSSCRCSPTRSPERKA